MTLGTIIGSYRLRGRVAAAYVIGSALLALTVVSACEEAGPSSADQGPCLTQLFIAPPGGASQPFSPPYIVELPPGGSVLLTLEGSGWVGFDVTRRHPTGSELRYSAGLHGQSALGSLDAPGVWHFQVVGGPDGTCVDAFDVEVRNPG
jgi:hypothetical protein